MIRRLLLALATLLAVWPANTFAQGRAVTINPVTGRAVWPARIPTSLLPMPDFTANATLSIDSRLTGLTASDSTKLIYSTFTQTGSGTYVRSTTDWSADIDLTAVSVGYNVDGGTFLGAYPVTAITPRHVVRAYHVTEWDTGAIQYRFVGSDGATVTRTVSSFARVGSTDIEIAKLDSDLPSTVTPARVLGSDYAEYLSARFAPLLVVDQERKAAVKMLSVDGSVETFTVSNTENRLNFDETLGLGDSSSPAFFLQGREPVLVLSAATAGTGDAIANDFSATDAVLTSLGGGYSLTAFAAQRAVRLTLAPYNSEYANLPLLTLNATTGYALSVASTSGTGIFSISTSGLAFSGSTGNGGAMLLTNNSAASQTLSIENIDETNTGPLLTASTFDAQTVLRIENNGEIDWPATDGGTEAVAKAATRANLGVPALVTKDTTGDPAAPTGSEPTLCINTFDNTLKIYADGAWRSITTW